MYASYHASIFEFAIILFLDRLLDAFDFHMLAAFQAAFSLRWRISVEPDIGDTLPRNNAYTHFAICYRARRVRHGSAAFIFYFH